MVDSLKTGATPHATPAPAGGVLPAHVAAMQARTEQLYLKTLALERDVAQLRATQPVVVTRPLRTAFVMRALRRASPRLQRRHQLRLIRNCGLFDAQWYLRTYPDIAREGADPALHYLLHGATDLRNPGPYFDTGHYLHLYPDIAQIGMNPLVHYIVAGITEKRSIRPGMPHEAS